MGSTGVSSPTFVGRGEELELLASAFASAVEGQTRAVFVGGDAGVGKTRLVAEFCGRAMAERSDVLVASGVCVPVEGGGLALGPFAGVLRDLARQLGERTAAELLGSLAHGLTTDATGRPGEKRQRAADELAKAHLFESILAAIDNLAARSPLVLVLDDLQWADSSSAELLGFLVRNLVDLPALLVGTYRSDEVGPDHELRPWLAELSRHPRVTELRLEGLGKDELRTMIAGIVGHDPDWTLVEAVWARSQGNPFFAEELTAAGPSPSLPPDLARVIMTRVEGLSKKAQQALRILAVAGMAAEHRLLAAVADGFDGEALDAAVADAVDHQILVVDESGTGYRFRHALLREAVEASLLPGERVRTHRRLADAITADPSLAPGATTLAVHWWGAGEWAEAYSASRAAADAACALWAFPEALVHLDRAVAAVERMPADLRPPAAECVQLLTSAADVAYLSGAAERSVQLAQAAVDATDVDADPLGAGRRYALLGRNSWALGDSDVTFAAYRKAIELIPTDPPSPELAGVLGEEGRGLMLLSRFAEAETRCLAAIDAARRVGARAEEGHALNTLGTCWGLLGRVDEGTDLLRQALAIAQQVGVPDDIDRAYTNLSCVLVDACRFEEAIAVLDDALVPGERIGFLRLSGAAGNAVHALRHLGRYDEAEALIAQMGDKGVGICASAPQIVPLPIAIRRGRFDEAHVLLAGAEQRTARLSDVQTRGQFHMLAAELALEEGRPDDASDEVERALALLAGTEDEYYGPQMCALGIRALADRLDDAQAHGRRVDVDKFRLLARGLVEDAEKVAAAPVARGAAPKPVVLAFVALCSAEASRLGGTDPELWAAAASASDTARDPYQTAYCRWREAEALLRGRTGRARADASLQEAWSLASGLGARPLAERVSLLAQRARIPLRGEGAVGDGSSVGDDLGLTPREVEVLGQLAAGRTDKEIADELFISKKTASVHVSNLLRKLDVANRVEAGRVGQAHGLG